MIDWLNLFFNALWIVGVSLLLAKFSYQRWARQQPETAQQQLELGSPLQLCLFNSFVYLIIGIGLVGVNDGIWIRLGWIIVVVLSLVSEYLTYRDKVLPE